MVGKLEVARVTVKGVWDIVQEKGFPQLLSQGSRVSLFPWLQAGKVPGS